MTISSSNQVNTYNTEINSNQTTNADDTTFSDMLNAKNKKTKRELEDEKCAADSKALFESIDKAGGALNYVIKSNFEKIQKLIDEKQKELEDKLGLNSTPPLTGDALKQANDTLKKELDEYKKELMKQLKAQSKLDEKSNTQLDIQPTTSLAKILQDFQS